MDLILESDAGLIHRSLLEPGGNSHWRFPLGPNSMKIAALLTMPTVSESESIMPTILTPLLTAITPTVTRRPISMTTLAV